MDGIVGKLKEATAVYAGMRAYKLLLDLVITFLLVSVLLQIVGFSMAYSIIPAVIYLIYQMLRELRRMNVIKQIEGRYDGLKESLETAYEYRERKNIIVESLLSDVTRKMDSVESSTFFKTKEVAVRVAAVVFLLFAMMTITVLDLRGAILDFMLDSTGVGDKIKDGLNKAGNQFDTMMGDRWEQSNWTTKDEQQKLGAQSGGERPGISQGPTPGTGGGTGENALKDIYGEASSANIQGENLDFRLHPEYGGEIEIRETGGALDQKSFELSSVESAETCDDCVIGPEHEEMVRKYFEKILAES